MSRLDGPRSPDSDELCVIKYLVNRNGGVCRARSPLALPSAVELNADDWVPQIYHTPTTRRSTPRALPPPLVCTFQWRAFRCVEGCTFKVSNLLQRRLCTARGVDEKRRRN